MKRFIPSLALTSLLIASLACNALSTTDTNSQPAATDTSAQPNSSEPVGVADEDIPIPEGTSGLQTFDNTTLFLVPMSVEEGANYYQTEMQAKGYVEETAITVISDDLFSLVFSGHSSGNEVAITGIDQGDGTINITIELRDILTTPADANSQPPTTDSSAQSNSNNPAGVVDEEIPVPEGAFDLKNVADTLMFNVAMTIEEGAKYYQTEMPARGYAEVPSITRISEGSFTLVYSGHPSGLEVYIAGTENGDGTINIAIELREILK